MNNEQCTYQYKDPDTEEIFLPCGLPTLQDGLCPVHQPYTQETAIKEAKANGITLQPVCEYLTDYPNSAQHCGKPAAIKSNHHYFCADCLAQADERIEAAYQEAKAALEAMAKEPMEEL